MRAVLITALLLFCSTPEAVADIFTVKPGTTFYSKPKGSETNKLQLPEVRVRIPPPAGFQRLLSLQTGLQNRRSQQSQFSRDGLGKMRIHWHQCQFAASPVMQMFRLSWAISALSLVLASSLPNLAEDSSGFLCSNGSSTAPCRAELSNDALTLTLKDGSSLTAKRLGDWKQSRTESGMERSCNVRIDLGDDFVYGLLKVNSKKGTSLIWPQRQIDINDLKD